MPIDASVLNEPLQIYRFVRDTHFYLVDLHGDADACANAECNPGTIRVENMLGRQVWPTSAATDREEIMKSDEQKSNSVPAGAGPVLPVQPSLVATKIAQTRAHVDADGWHRDDRRYPSLAWRLQ